MTDATTRPTLPVNTAEIERLLPHRYPFLLVDRVVELEPNKRVLAYKNVTANEPFFQGHFPGRPVMPGVLVVEAMAQAGGLLTQLSKDPDEPLVVAGMQTNGRLVEHVERADQRRSERGRQVDALCLSTRQR